MERQANFGMLRELPRCPFCHEGIPAGIAQLACNTCRAWHHQACWIEGGSKCSACGEEATGLGETQQLAANAHATWAESAHDVVDPDWAPTWGNAIAPPYRVSRAPYLIPLAGLLTALGLFACIVYLASTLGSKIRPSTYGGLTVLATLGAALAGFMFWALRSDGSEPERLRLPPPDPRLRKQLSDAIPRHFAQSEASFAARGLSLVREAKLELEHTLVICMERAETVDQLFHVLDALTRDTSGTPVALVVGAASADVIALFHVNCGRGVFPGLVLRADAAGLRSLSEATGATLLAAETEVLARHVGRARRVEFTKGEVAFHPSAGEVVRLPFEPDQPTPTKDGSRSTDTA